jgi:SM-20-related protein
MQPLPNHVSTRFSAACQSVCTQLMVQGWCVQPEFLDDKTVSTIRQAALQAWQAGRFRAAGIGRGKGFEIKPVVRNDQVLWLDPAECDPVLQDYLAVLERLRLQINQHLYLGLFDYEAHLARYSPGSFYRKHLDQFQGIGSRVLTTTFYLNPDWRAADGGQLRLYTESGHPERYVEILPSAGTLVCFLSSEFLHEVLPVNRERLSITGWFRRRGD